MLATICIILAVIGLIVVVLAVLPGTAAIMLANAFYYGVALLVLGVVLYVILYLLTRSPSVAPDCGLGVMHALDIR